MSLLLNNLQSKRVVCTYDLITGTCTPNHPILDLIFILYYNPKVDLVAPVREVQDDIFCRHVNFPTPHRFLLRVSYGESNDCDSLIFWCSTLHYIHYSFVILKHLRIRSEDTEVYACSLWRSAVLFFGFLVLCSYGPQEREEVSS